MTDLGTKISGLELLQSVNASLLEARAQGRQIEAFSLTIQPSPVSPYPSQLILTPHYYLEKVELRKEGNE